MLRLTPRQRWEVLCRYLPGRVSMRELAQDYGVHLSSISRIVAQAGGNCHRPPDPRTAEGRLARCQNAHCQQPFDAVRRSHRFCSRQCRQAQWLRQRRARTRTPQEKGHA